MATFEKPKPSEHVPVDLLPVIFESGVLTERQFSDLRAKVLRGDYPNDPRELAGRLVREKVLTEYQARRLLSNKPYGLVVGRYLVLDRIGSGSMASHRRSTPPRSRQARSLIRGGRSPK